MSQVKKVEKTSFNFPPDLLEQFRERCLKRGNMSQSKGVQDAMRLWLDATTPKSDAPEKEIDPDSFKSNGSKPKAGLPPAVTIDTLPNLKAGHVPWVQRLVKVLESGHEVAIRAIQSNLEAFEMLAGGGGDGQSHRDAEPEGPRISPRVAGLARRATADDRSAADALRKVERGRGDGTKDRTGSE